MSSMEYQSSPKNAPASFLIQKAAMRCANRMPYRLLLPCSLAFIGLLLFSCEPPATSNYSSRTVSATNTPYATPKPVLTGTRLVPSTPSFRSGGLGLIKTSWENEHILGEDWIDYTNYDDGKYSVMFIAERVRHLERNFSGDLPSLAEARGETAGLIPSDSRFLETYSPEGMPELIVDLYISQSLADCFPTDTFIGGEPGNFIAIYGIFEDKVPRIVIGLGNNP